MGFLHGGAGGVPDSDHLRITILLPSVYHRRNGGYKVAYEYANHLAARGHAVTVAHIEVDPLGLRTIAVNRGLPIRVKRPAWFTLDPRIRSMQWGRWTRAAVRGADVVIATAWRTAEKLGQHANGYYLIQHYETWDGPADRVDRTWRLPLRKVVIATWLADKSIELGGGPVTIIPNAIDIEIFDEDLPQAARSSNEVAMLWHEQPWKGSADGLEALRMVRASRPDLHVTLFSVSAPPPGLPAWVSFVRQADQVALRRIYNAAAVFVSPSHAEGWPLPPAEAMACGAALVSTDIDGVRDYALDGETALLSPVGDPSLLAGRISELLDDVERRSRIAAAGRRLIRERFNWDASTDALEDLIRSNLAVGPASPGVSRPSR